MYVERMNMSILTENNQQNDSLLSVVQNFFPFELIEDRYQENKKHIEILKKNLYEQGIHVYDDVFEQLSLLINPEYYPLLNKKVVADVVKNNGKNLYQGLINFQRDLQKNVIPKLSDIHEYQLGVNIASSKGVVVYQNHLMQLIHYRSLTKKQYQDPVLIVPPWINKYYIFDLDKEKSFVQYMLKQHLDVYVISWKSPQKGDHNSTLSSYIHQGIDAALDHMNQKSHVMGLCVGGLISLIASMRNNAIQSVSLLATPIDFEKLNELQAYIKKINTDQYKQYLKETGYQSGKELLRMFSMMRAESMILKNMVDQYYLNKDPLPNPFLYWNMDSTNIPAKMHLEYIQKFVIENQLFEGKYKLDGKKIKISDLKKPVFVVATEKDHIVPYQAAFALKKFNLNCRYVFAGSGHIAGIINPPKQKKYAYRVFDHNQQLMIEKKYSWWVEWKNWIIEQQEGFKKPLKDKNYIEEAPGTYAKEQPFIDIYRD